MADEPENEGSADSPPEVSSPAPGRTETDVDGGAKQWWSTRSELRSFAELLGLTGLAIAQPVLAVFGNDASSFVAVRAGTSTILLFAVVVVLAPPVLLWTAERLVGFAGETPRRWLHLGYVAGLTGLFASRLFPAPLGPVSAALVVIAAAGATVLVARTAAARQFLRYLAFAPLLFVVMFIGFSPVSSLVFGSDPPAAGPLDAEELPPIVMIVLDELPMTSLLDGDGNIDADAYPGLAGLAEGATFARNHTTVSPSTPVAVPTILTGVTPGDPDSVATARAHPQNLFTLLGDDYEVRASEHVTQMCPSKICETPGVEETRSDPLWMLLRQVPDVFTMSKVFFNIGFEDVDPAGGFEWLTGSVGVQDGEPTLNYLHSLLPHQDWKHLPGGKTYDAPNPPFRGSDADDDGAPAQLARQRHLLQLAYADELVGGVVEDLRAAGVYDETLIIVTADHGVSFRPDEPLRPLTEENYPDVMWTPLLIKAPQQQVPQLIDSPTASIDVVPTIIDLLDVDVDWDLDGRSVFGEPRPEDWHPRTLAWEFDEIEPDADGFVYFDGPAGHAEVLQSSALDFDPEWDLRFWRWGANGDLIGQEVGALDVTEAGDATATVDSPERFSDVDPTADSVPAYISGRVTGGEPGPVAVAVNGVIGGWYDTSVGPTDEAGRRFAVMVPPALLREGDNDVEVFLVAGRGDDRTLIRTSASR